MKGLKELQGIIIHGRDFLLQKKENGYEIPGVITGSYDYSDELAQGIFNATGISVKVSRFVGDWESDKENVKKTKIYLCTPLSGLEIEEFNTKKDSKYTWLSFDHFEEEASIAEDLELFEILQKVKEKSDLEFPKTGV
jgi:hypothetical protein